MLCWVGAAALQRLCPRSGLLLVVIGVVLLRHLHLTVALIGLIIGVTWTCRE